MKINLKNKSNILAGKSYFILIKILLVVNIPHWVKITDFQLHEFEKNSVFFYRQTIIIESLKIDPQMNT